LLADARDPVASVQGSTPTHYLTDGLGSTTELADDDGTVTGTYAYDAFGPVRAHTGASQLLHLSLPMTASRC
jgi:hypothetical protein